MANNRAVLVCNVCNPDEWHLGTKETRSDVFVLAKYYPMTGYGRSSSDPSFHVRMDEWLEAHYHDGIDYVFRLEFEIKK